MHYNGQPIGVVVADTFEHAMARCERSCERTYAEQSAGARHGDRAKDSATEQRQARGGERADTHAATSSGARERRRARRAHVHDAVREPQSDGGAQHHRAVGGRPVSRSTSRRRASSACANTVARRRSASRRTMSGSCRHFTGGGFGSKGVAWSHEMLAAMAATQVGRPGEARAHAPSDVRTRRRTPAHGATRHARREAETARSPRSGTRARRTTSTLEDWVEPAPSRRECSTRRRTSRPIIDLVRLNVGYADVHARAGRIDRHVRARERDGRAGVRAAAWIRSRFG